MLASSAHSFTTLSRQLMPKGCRFKGFSKEALIPVSARCRSAGAHGAGVCCPAAADRAPAVGPSSEALAAPHLAARHNVVQLAGPRLLRAAAARHPQALGAVGVDDVAFAGGRAPGGEGEVRGRRQGLDMGRHPQALGAVGVGGVAFMDLWRGGGGQGWRQGGGMGSRQRAAWRQLTGTPYRVLRPACTACVCACSPPLPAPPTPSPLTCTPLERIPKCAPPSTSHTALPWKALHAPPSPLTCTP
jgi:hypothetical protein